MDSTTMELEKDWAELSGQECAARVTGIIDGLESEQSYRRERYTRNRSIYELREMAGVGAQDYVTGTADEGPFALDRLHLCRSAISHAAATVYAPQKPKPQFQTLGATWAIRRKAYRLDRICEGVLNQRQGRFVNLWAFMTDAGIEAGTQGVAPVKTTADLVGKRVEFELVPHIRLYTDPAEGREPRNLFERSPMPLKKALKRWPGSAKAIKEAKDFEFPGSKSSRKTRATRCITVDYAWQLGDGKDAPGRFVVVIGGECVEGATPKKGKFLPPSFPFVFLYWEMHRDGHWGAGIPDEGYGLANDAGEIAYRLQRRAIVASGKKGYYHTNSVKPDDLAHNEEITWVPVEEGAEMPQESLVPPFSPMELDHMQQRVQMFWDAVGLSQVSAAARREPGLTSGIALMTLNDTKSGRQLIKAQRYENAYVDIAHQIVWRFREIAEKDPKFTVKWPGKGMIHEEDWKGADTDDDMFNVQVAPASALPHDPAGRQEAVDKLLAMRLISPETAKTLIGWPDLDSELNMETSEGEYLDMLIGMYLDADEGSWDMNNYQSPEGFIFNKVWAMRRFSSAWFRARIDQSMLKSEEEKQKVEFNISLLTRFIRELDALMAPPPLPPDQSPIAKGMEQVAAAKAARQPAPVGGMGLPAPPGAVPPAAVPQQAPPG